MLGYMRDIANSTGKLSNIRGIGGIVAADLLPLSHGRISNELYKHALEYGALIRPMGNTLYWLPPLNTEKEIIGN